MSKNMTRKTLSVIAASSMAAAAFVAAPANAAGLADTSFVSLAPSSGKAYNVLAIAGNTFGLKANQASSITGAGKNVKFLVEDANKVVRPATGTTATGTTNVEDWSADAGDNTVTITDTAHGLSAGDFVYVSGLIPQENTNTTDQPERAAAWGEITEVTTNTFSFVDAAGVAADIDEDDDDGTNSHGRDNTGVYTVVTRATSGNFVVNSADATNTSDKILVLENISSTATVSVDVTAWVDDNSNGTIDATEYVSPTRTVSFVGAATVTPNVAWTPVVIGDETVTATVTLSPTINFDQENKARFEVDLERQGSSAVEGTDDGANTRASESWDTDDQEWTITGTLKETGINTVEWTGLKTPVLDTYDKNSSPAITHFAQAGSTATFTTATAHNLSVNDEITVTTFLASAANAKVTAVTDTTFSYTTTATAATTAKTAIGANAPSVALNEFGFATAGDYKATVKLGSTPAKIGATSIISAGTQVSAGVKNVATLSDSVSADFKVRKGTTAAVQVTSTVTKADKTVVPAGTPVSIAVTETSTGIVTVNGTTVTGSKTIAATTDANGQVVITVTNSSAADGETVALAVSSQGFSDTDTLTWENAAYALTDLLDNDTTGVEHRNVAANGEVPFNLALRDQWGQAPSGDFRVKVVGAGTRYVSTTYESLNNGSLNYTWKDTPVDASSSTGTVTFSVEQKNAAGSWVTPNGTAPLVALKGDGAGEIHADNLTINVRGTAGTNVALNADGISSADLSASAATVSLKAADTRTPGVSANDVSSETNDVTATITGTVKDAFTGVAQPGSAVTISGNSAILFENGAEAAYGELTVYASSTGTFSVNAYSNSSLTDSVVTVSANGASNTVKVSFVGAGADAGTAWDITAPTSAVPGSTFQVTAKLTDVFGNGVQVTTAGDIKVTYTGPGLIVGTLPDVTDKDGELTFSVLLGSNDQGTAAMTFSYDQNSDDDFVDAKDVVATKSIIVGDAPVTQKVNAGSFKGYVAVYALGYEGQRLSAKIGNDWVIVDPIVNNESANLARVTDFTGAGVDIQVRIYIDRVLTATIPLTTK